jgi:hypothetical protein
VQRGFFHAFVMNCGYAGAIQQGKPRKGTMNNTDNFNATEFCSKKLWDMVRGDNNSTSQEELAAAVAELANRRHYLSELEQLGVFDKRGH